MASDSGGPSRTPGRSGRFAAVLSLSAGILLLLSALVANGPAGEPAGDRQPRQKKSSRGPGATALLVSVLAIGLALLLYGLRPADLWLGRYLPLGLLVVAAAVAIAALARGRVTLFRRITAGFGAAAPWVPFIAAIATVSAMLVVPNADSATGRLVATGSGLLLALAGWGLLGGGMAYGNHPARVNSRVWAELNERYRTLRTRLDALDVDRASAPYLEAKAHLDWLACIGVGVGDCAADEGEVQSDQAVVNWAQGYRYVDLLTTLHRAEEAMLELLPQDQLAAEVWHDRLRLSGSLLSGLASKISGDQKSGRKENARPAEFIPLAVREVRHALNDFRDSRVDGIVRARNGLARTTMMTSFTAYLLLLLALALGAPRISIAAAAIFFLVGALIGLFAQLRRDAKVDEAVEDYGLTAARLRQTAFVSGLAAIAGILLTAIAIDTTGTIEEAATLEDIFNVGSSPGQLLIAAVFGLSPQLVIQHLTARAEEYRKQLGETDPDPRAVKQSSDDDAWAYTMASAGRANRDPHIAK